MTCLCFQLCLWLDLYCYVKIKECFPVMLGIYFAEHLVCAQPVQKHRENVHSLHVNQTPTMVTEEHIKSFQEN